MKKAASKQDEYPFAKIEVILYWGSGEKRDKTARVFVSRVALLSQVIYYIENARSSFEERMTIGNDSGCCCTHATNFMGQAEVNSDFFLMFFKNKDIASLLSPHFSCSHQIYVSNFGKFEDGDWLAILVVGHDVSEWCFFRKLTGQAKYEEIFPSSDCDVLGTESDRRNGELVYNDMLFPVPCSTGFQRNMYVPPAGKGLWPDPVVEREKMGSRLRAVGLINFILHEDEENPLTMLIQAGQPWKGAALSIAEKLKEARERAINLQYGNARAIIESMLRPEDTSPLSMLTGADQQPWRGVGLQVLRHLNKIRKEANNMLIVSER